MHDPMEAIVAEALDDAGIAYVTDEGGGNPSGLDFRLHNGVEIEVKRFHSPRIAAQMARWQSVIRWEKDGNTIPGPVQVAVEAMMEKVR